MTQRIDHAEAVHVTTASSRGREQMKPVRKPQHHICPERTCQAKVNTAHKAKKHNAKTGHVMVVNWIAENAHVKYLARTKPGYLARLDQKIAQEEGAWL